ncbi:uncharacterized protein LOC107013256 [Solanum pennellii]|uniref:Uncharacterized protein LOC107013256 n=1 Tax=Solanum pennellii TaxID=28526 RepID=A0ABM1GBJ6_SOLPN|nr:uncharacterized protein LOC107013256 [Solanum pennellii]
MAHLRTQFDFLTKHIVSKSKKVNVVGQQSRYDDQGNDIDEEANYFGNKVGARNYNSGHQGGSKLEDTIAKMLQNVESTDARVKEMRGTKDEQVKDEVGTEEDESSPVNDLEELSVNIQLVEALEQMQGYAKFTKDLVTKKIVVSLDFSNALQCYCNQIFGSKKEDPGAFTIPYNIRSIKFANALCDLGAIINLMPLPIYEKLGSGMPKPTTMRLMMVDMSVKRPVGILCDIFVKVDKFIFPEDFVILDCEVDFEVPIILGRPFLATGRALVDVERGEFKIRLN